MMTRYLTTEGIAILAALAAPVRPLNSPAAPCGTYGAAPAKRGFVLAQAHAARRS